MPQRVLTEQEFNRIRDRVLQSAPDGLDEPSFHRWIGPAMEQALGEAENTPAAPEGSATSRFLSNAGEMVNPVSIAKGLYGAVRHPIETVTSIGEQMADQAVKAKEAWGEGRISEAVGHAAAAAIPVIGPAAAAAGEQIGSGDVAGGLGKGAGLLIPTMVPTAVRTVRTAVTKLPESVATAANAGARSRITNVMSPKVGQNKVRFGNMADKVAPAIAKDIATEGAPWTREGLHARIGEKLGEAEAALDAASDARLAARTFPTAPLIGMLRVKRAQLMAEAVEGSHPIPTVHGAGGTPTPSGLTRNVSTGRMQPALVKEGRALGQDVIPAPYAARVAVIDQAISELQRLGPMVRYDPIRTMRQAYDGPAKAVYSPAVTPDFIKAQGGARGAADVTAVLRDQLARWDPPTAQANAQYSLYRTANDVLDAAVEVDRARPKVGRQIMARLTGSIIGGQVGGPIGAVAGYTFGPVVDAALSAGATTQLKTAAMMAKLAQAIRSGNIGVVNSLTAQLRRVGTTAAAVVGGGSTSPNGPRTAATAPAQ